MQEAMLMQAIQLRHEARMEVLIHCSNEQREQEVESNIRKSS